MFCIVITYGVEYRIMEIKQYSIYFVSACNDMECFKAVHMSVFLSNMYLFPLHFPCMCMCSVCVVLA
jgi:hypothetical protein